MKGIELLNSWKVPLNEAIKATWLNFYFNKKLILTESDLKCQLYSELIKRIPTPPYSVHSEVTHYFNELKENNLPEKKYRFRDMTLLSPSKIILNEELWQKNDKTLNKGFKHRGEAIFIELKFDRQNTADVDPMDIENLISYKGDPNYPKLFYIIWGSLNNDIDKLDKLMLKNLQKLINEGQNKSIFPNVYGYIFNNECYKGYNFNLNSSKNIWEIKMYDTLTIKDFIEKYRSEK